MQVVLGGQGAGRRRCCPGSARLTPTAAAPAAGGWGTPPRPQPRFDLQTAYTALSPQEEGKNRSVTGESFFSQIAASRFISRPLRPPPQQEKKRVLSRRYRRPRAKQPRFASKSVQEMIWLLYDSAFPTSAAPCLRREAGTAFAAAKKALCTLLLRRSFAWEEIRACPTLALLKTV